VPLAFCPMHLAAQFAEDTLASVTIVPPGPEKGG
jgi:hypothetical protein